LINRIQSFPWMHLATARVCWRVALEVHKAQTISPEAAGGPDRLQHNAGRRRSHVLGLAAHLTGDNRQLLFALEPTWSNIN
jgi:hypothetical protein